MTSTSVAQLIDTNVLVYRVDARFPAKQETATNVLEDNERSRLPCRRQVSGQTGNSDKRPRGYGPLWRMSYPASGIAGILRCGDPSIAGCQNITAYVRRSPPRDRNPAAFLNHFVPGRKRRPSCSLC